MPSDKVAPDTDPKSAPSPPPRSDDLRARAADIIHSVNSQLDALEESGQMEKLTSAGANVPGPVGMLFKVIDSVDANAVRDTVAKARRAHPDDSDRELARRLIRDKAVATGIMGGTTSLVGLVPGLGTLAAVSLGVTADLITTFRLETELVMEIAELLGRKLTPSERRTAVLAITGLGMGLNAVGRRVGTKLTIEVGERYAGKTIMKAIPVAGIFASAGVNVLATRVVGDRALAYFSGKPLVPFTEQISQVSDTAASQAQRWWTIASTRVASGLAAAGPKAAATLQGLARRRSRDDTTDETPGEGDAKGSLVTRLRARAGRSARQALNRIKRQDVVDDAAPTQS